jgi:hypothetical protein
LLKAHFGSPTALAASDVGLEEVAYPLDGFGDDDVHRPGPVLACQRQRPLGALGQLGVRLFQAAPEFAVVGHRRYGQYVNHDGPPFPNEEKLRCVSVSVNANCVVSQESLQQSCE